MNLVLDFWTAEGDGVVPKLNNPFSRPRPTSKTFCLRPRWKPRCKAAQSARRLETKTLVSVTTSLLQ